MIQNDPKYIEFSNSLNTFLKSTHDYIDHLKERKSNGEYIDKELDELIKLCHLIVAEYTSIKWAVHDLQQGDI
jgi:hypothetical protein